MHSNTKMLILNELEVVPSQVYHSCFPLVLLVNIVDRLIVLGFIDFFYLPWSLVFL